MGWSTDDMVYNSITDALAQIAHLEHEWDLPKLEKRIRIYGKNAAKTLEFGKKPWQQLVQDYADRFFSSIFHGLGDRKWLNRIDFAMVIHAGVKAMFPDHLLERVPPSSFECVVLNAHDRAFEEQRFVPLLWETLRRYPFSKKEQSRVYAAFEAGRKEAAVSTNGQVDDFVRWWVMKTFEHLQGSCAIHGPPAETVSMVDFAQIVHDLLQADGLPLPLTASRGLPPVGWPHVDSVVRDVYASREPKCSQRQTDNGAAGGFLGGAHSNTSSTRKRKAAVKVKAPSSDSDEFLSGSHCKPKRAMRAMPVGSPEDGGRQEIGHPRCTQQEECVGSSDSVLVQHMLGGSQGDIYCNDCWAIFSKADPTLKSAPYRGR
eukprot:TRINITY_DN2556_c0_g1_i1.p1 TRINITY_DN2556_c0_g1~~TRINITY_DN2556_c0_g1_i1.p1  ORF type:complete len:373 (-),score=38.34 TRINITY_DN2556_c0_g1_i1:159-1277(-)